VFFKSTGPRKTWKLRNRRLRVSCQPCKKSKTPRTQKVPPAQRAPCCAGAVFPPKRSLKPFAPARRNASKEVPMERRLYDP